jgi:hypothetical protein
VVREVAPVRADAVGALANLRRPARLSPRPGVPVCKVGDPTLRAPSRVDARGRGQARGLRARSPDPSGLLARSMKMICLSDKKGTPSQPTPGLHRRGANTRTRSLKGRSADLGILGDSRGFSATASSQRQAKQEPGSLPDRDHLRREPSRFLKAYRISAIGNPWPFGVQQGTAPAMRARKARPFGPHEGSRRRRKMAARSGAIPKGNAHLADERRPGVAPRTRRLHSCRKRRKADRQRISIVALLTRG